MLVLSGPDIESLLSPDQIIREVEAALLAHERDGATVPARQHINVAGKTMLYMPAFAEKVFGTKLVSVVPGNRTKGLPVTNGVMVLNDAETGLPIAIFDAARLTALRTGALGAIGVRYLSPERETTVGLIGCGVQGVHQVIFTCAMRKMKTVYYLHRSDASAATLVDALRRHQPGVAVIPCATPSELLNQTNIIIAATTSPEPVLPDDEILLAKKHFIGIGSYKPSMQELPDSVYRLAGHLVLDSELARHETGDSLNPVRKGILLEENVFTLGKVMTGERTVDVNGTTVFKSAGMALFDLFVAHAMYEEALKTGNGTSVVL